MKIEVTDDADARRYEAIAEDAAVAGYISYELRDGRVAMLHTEVEDAYEGEGVGSSLVEGALEMVRASGLMVLPYCPFVAAYLKRHKEFQNLVPVDRRTQFGLPESGSGS